MAAPFTMQIAPTAVASSSTQQPIPGWFATLRQCQTIHEQAAYLAPICPVGTCSGEPSSCPGRGYSIHFLIDKRSHTDLSAGECPWLDKCRNIGSCKKIHYRYVPAVFVPTPPTIPKSIYRGPFYPPQWICTDIEQFDFGILRDRYAVIECDPPWGIAGLKLSYDLVADDRAMTRMLEPIVSLQSQIGVFVMWSTTNMIDFARRIMLRFGYRLGGEVIWIKVNHLHQQHDRAYSGVWLNHAKEHALVFYKGTEQQLLDHGFTIGVFPDVIVAEPREPSRKPDEMRRMLTTMAPPGCAKLGVFDRQHNTYPEFLSIGNQLTGQCVYDSSLQLVLAAKYGNDWSSREMLVGQTPHDVLVQDQTSPAYNAHRLQSALRDYSQHYVNTLARVRPQNFVVPSTAALFHRELAMCQQFKASWIEQHRCSALTIRDSCSDPQRLVQAYLPHTRFGMVLINLPLTPAVLISDGKLSSTSSPISVLRTFPFHHVLSHQAFVAVTCGSTHATVHDTREALISAGLRIIETIAIVRTTHTHDGQQASQVDRHVAPTAGQTAEFSLFQPTWEQCILATNITGNTFDATRTFDWRNAKESPIAHARSSTDVIFAEQTSGESIETPGALYQLLEYFCTDKRRLQILSNTPRAGWVTVGPGIPSTTFDEKTYQQWLAESPGRDRLPLYPEMEEVRPQKSQLPPRGSPLSLPS